MSPEIKKMLDDVESIIDELDECNHSIDDEFRIIELKLKYLEVIALKSINQNLFEISHFGIGTD